MFSLCVLGQLIEEVQVKQPDVEFVLERANELYKEIPASQPDKVRTSNTVSNLSVERNQHHSCVLCNCSQLNVAEKSHTLLFYMHTHTELD